MPTLLVVDDEPLIRHSFQKLFAGGGVAVVTAGTLTEGEAAVRAHQPDVIVLDLQLPDGSGLDLFDRLRADDPRRPVVFLTAHGSTDAAIEAMKRGAFDYLLKPVDLDRMTKLLATAFDAARLMRQPAALPDDPGPDRILGRSPVMQEMCKTVGRVAGQDVNVLILGESGVGKELVARAIYQHSRRADRPFLALNCAAIPETLVESELFGHEQGAFTGADRKRIGRFEQCGDGTLLLDEIGDMPLPVQAKMLRLLQDQRFERVGGSQTLSTRVRVLAATNRDLSALIAAGQFRGDLYYRLKVVTIRVPPLRERTGDLPELAHHHLYQYAREMGRDVRGFAEGVLTLLEAYPWPGNVRELQGILKDGLLRTAGHLFPADVLPDAIRSPAAATAPTPVASAGGPPLSAVIDALLADGKGEVHKRLLGRVERELVGRALQHTGGHQTQASELLGINRTTLRTKLREFGLEVGRVVSDRPDAADEPR